jgi:hypothetical protein
MSILHIYSNEAQLFGGYIILRILLRIMNVYYQ